MAYMHLLLMLCPNTKFLTPPTEDLFAHYSAIEMDGYKTLKAGQTVAFDIIQGPKGLHAVKIRAAAKTETAAPTSASTTTLA